MTAYAAYHVLYGGLDPSGMSGTGVGFGYGNNWQTLQSTPEQRAATRRAFKKAKDFVVEGTVASFNRPGSALAGAAQGTIDIADGLKDTGIDLAIDGVELIEQMEGSRNDARCQRLGKPLRGIQTPASDWLRDRADKYLKDWSKDAIVDSSAYPRDFTRTTGTIAAGIWFGSKTLPKRPKLPNTPSTVSRIDGHLPGTLDDLSVRNWYHKQLDAISGQIDEAQSIRNQARQAFELRNQAKRNARDLMMDRQKACSLDQTDPLRTWEEQILHSYGKGNRGSDIYQGILDSSTKSRPSVDANLGLSR